MNINFYNRIPKKPKDISIWELVQYNYISEDDIDINGKVDDTVYERALRTYKAEMGNSNINKKKQSFSINIPRLRSTNNSHINNVRLIKDAINENRKIQERELCCICLTNNITHVFIPCFHLCTCRTCASKVDKCPKCRTKIEEKHRVWF